MQTRILSLAGILLAASVLSIGCEPADTAAAKDGGLSDMVAELDTFHTKIKDGLEAGDKAGNDAAHGALHGVFDVLGKLAAVGTGTGLEAADRDKVKASAEAMAEVYVKIDKAQHADDFTVGSIDYSEHATALSEALAELKSFCK